MSLVHLLLTLLVIVIWGINFIFLKLGLQEFPPFLLCAIRFFLASFPAIFFVQRPQQQFHWVAVYGLVMFGMQFALVFLAFRAGMTAGMASLIMQMQVFFTLFLTIILLKEIPEPPQIFGALISFTGLGVVAFHLDSQVSLAGFLLVLLASMSWGVGNLVTKKLSAQRFIPVIIWGNFISFWPMLLMSLIIDGPHALAASYARLSGTGILAIFYIVYISTLLGYGIWSKLVARYPLGQIVPFTLLIPLVGILSSMLILREPFYLWKLWAGTLIIIGLVTNLLGTKLWQARRSLTVAPAHD